MQKSSRSVAMLPCITTLKNVKVNIVENLSFCPPVMKRNRRPCLYGLLMGLINVKGTIYLFRLVWIIFRHIESLVWPPWQGQRENSPLFMSLTLLLFHQCFQLHLFLFLMISQPFKCSTNKAQRLSLDRRWCAQKIAFMKRLLWNYLYSVTKIFCQ